MARVQERQKAINLRLQGHSYSEIKHTLGISKSTLSNWLSKYPLTEKQLLKISLKRGKSREIAIEKTRITKLRKREKRLIEAYQQEKSILLPLKTRELYIAGLFLYWGEGSKNLQGSVSLNNTDPDVVKFYLYWLTSVLQIPVAKIKVQLHMYSDMDIPREMDYWSDQLKIPIDSFSRPYIKRTKRSDIDHKGFGHGTCAIRVNNVLLKERIIMGIQSIADYYNQKI